MEWKTAVSQYLAPGESIEDSLLIEPERPHNDPIFYAVTDRRLIEMTSSGDSVSVTLEPLERARSVEVSRTEGTDNRDAYIALAAGCGLLGLLMIALTASTGQAAFLIVGLLLIGVGLLFGIGAASESSPGQVDLSVYFPNRERSISLPESGENFAQRVTTVVGAHQSQ